ncbi:glutathione synthase [Thioalkalivibrio sp. HK1]|uniref:glutathione synthase n=1 Tax=Thioalkalivibrio sp. HK1 TaxID=1469245 RepID=UPI0004729FF3|nr:glutathione synthase [Thioalkalivibrio sp. HK1]
MNVKMGIVMDPPASIEAKKDTTLALMRAAKKRGWSLFCIEMGGLYLRNGDAHADMHPIEVSDDDHDWYRLGNALSAPLSSLDTILMRKDPPFDMEYIYSTYILERAEEAGTLVVNRPKSLRDANEKMFTAWFPRYCPPTLVTRNHARMSAFLAEHDDIVIKPLDGMGGASIFRVRTGDSNAQVIFETLSAHQTRYAMCQRYLPEIRKGDHRVLMVDGEPMEYALARIPTGDDPRGNLAAGARGVAVEISPKMREIASHIGPELKARGLLFVGLDVIGGFLTEINVTSPTCIREIEAAFDIDIAGGLMDAIESRLGAAGKGS